MPDREVISTEKRMIYNKITMSFPAEAEKVFRKKYFSDSIIQFRIAFFLVTLLYGAFGYLDLLLDSELSRTFHIIRFYFVVPWLLLILLLSFTGFFSKIWQSLTLISMIIGGTGISIMCMLAPDNYAYYGGMMLVFMAGYFFIKLRFFMASIGGMVTLLIFNAGAIFFADTSSVILISYNFFFAGANVIGMFAAYNIEYYARRNFYMNHLLDLQKEALDNTNKHLEKTVEIRTKELVEARNLAIKSDQLKSAFLANMSHEIRTPMNGILGFADLLKKPGLTGEMQQKYIRIIEKSGARMLNIINDIVDISKIEAGLMRTDLQVSNINEQIEYIYTFFKPEVELKGMRLSYKTALSDKKASIISDREKVFAILTNLVKNAIKYTDSGSIEFGYDSTGLPSELRFFIKDTGIGIAIDRQEVIFERFIQADIADKNAKQGAGLGLSITKAYVEMLGGKIWVESEEGKGSTFYFTLPYYHQLSPDLEKSSDVQLDEISEDYTRLKILIAEDDETSELLTSEILQSLGANLIKVKTGSDAVEICKNNNDISIILMDIQMPGLNGYNATRIIREFNQDVIIIAQTAYSLSGDREKALDAGCNDYISKPVSKDILLECIKTNLTNKKSKIH